MRIILTTFLTLFIAFPAFAQMEASRPTQEAMEAARKRFQEAKEVAREKFQAQHTKLRQNLTVVRDVKKKEIIERVHDSINQLNTRSTTHLLSVVEHISELLDRIETRTGELSGSGVDVAPAMSAIQNARGLIESAKMTITAQASKTYDFNVTSETTLRSDVSVARDRLRTDLEVSRNKVKEALQAVRNAAVTLAQLPRS